MKQKTSAVNFQNSTVLNTIELTLLTDHNAVLYRNICPTDPTF